MTRLSALSVVSEVLWIGRVQGSSEESIELHCFIRTCALGTCTESRSESASRTISLSSLCYDRSEVALHLSYLVLKRIWFSIIRVTSCPLFTALLIHFAFSFSAPGVILLLFLIIICPLFRLIKRQESANLGLDLKQWLISCAALVVLKIDNGDKLHVLVLLKQFFTDFAWFLQ